jgi:hypothetical protein
MRRLWAEPHWLALIAVVALGAYLRRPIDLPLQYDPHSIDASRGILKHGLPYQPSGVLYLRGLPFLYLQAAGMALFGGPDRANGWIGVVLGAANILALYFWVRDAAGRTAGVVAAAMLAVFGWHIAYSSPRWYSTQHLFILLSLFFCGRAFGNGRPRPRAVIAFGVFTALALLTDKISAWLLAAPLYPIASQWLQRPRPRIGPLALGYAAGALIGATGMLVPNTVVPSHIAQSWTAVDFFGWGLDAHWPATYLRWYPGALPLLALGIALALFRRDLKAGFVYYAFLMPLAAITVLTVGKTPDRYVVFSIPAFVASLAVAWWQALDFARTRLVRGRGTLPGRVFVAGAIIGAMALSIALNPRSFVYELVKNYGLLVPEPNRPSQAYLAVCDTRTPPTFVNAHWRPGDAVISNSQMHSCYLTVPLSCYLDAHRLTTIGHEPTIQHWDGSWRYLYTGTPFIGTVSELAAVVKQSQGRVWVVLAWRFEPAVSPDASDFIKKRGRLVYQGPTPGDQVYVLTGGAFHGAEGSAELPPEVSPSSLPPVAYRGPAFARVVARALDLARAFP